MYLSKLKLKNWRNFENAEIELGDRAFFVGPNASGKSNLLDAVRFLRDLVKQGGGLQPAVSDRGGVAKIRSLAARSRTDIEISVELRESPEDNKPWRYEIGIAANQNASKKSTATLVYERVHHGNKLLVNRPDAEDGNDPLLRTQTHLEQLKANKEFRPVAEFFGSVSYLHLVPQFLKSPDKFQLAGGGEDSFGHAFLEHVAQATDRDRKKKFRRIETALKYAVPQLTNLELEKDHKGVPHLVARYKHWRPEWAGKQDETQFSDGTLRLIGLLWSLMEGKGTLLLEEPELSLHAGLVRRLPGLMYRVLSGSGRQVLVSTHSKELLSDKGIDSTEVFLLVPGKEGTEIQPAGTIREVQTLLDAGMNMGEVVIPRTEAPFAHQLDLFK